MVIGGGIQGLATALEAAERGLAPCVVERGRLASATSAAWFGILHGGLRYLQTLDIPRLRRSVVARRHLVAAFPEAVAVEPFLMPLYGRGMKRASAFRAAFAVERVLAADRNRALPAGAPALPPGRVIGPVETAERFPMVAREGLEGAALWHEAVERSPGALAEAMRTRALAAGVEIREETEAVALETSDARVAALVVDGPRGRARLETGALVNAAGPWAPRLAARLDPAATLPDHHVLGFNLVLDRPPPAEGAVSVQVPGRGPMLFLRPHPRGLYAGTWYVAPQPGPATAPTEADIAAFLAALNVALPALSLTATDVIAAPAGLLPGDGTGPTALADRDRLHDHGTAGGPSGLVTVEGVKFTTAPVLARRALEQLARCDAGHCPNTVQAQ
ncbi:MAG: FAD-dependent oxidoreductase [Pseudomonadota bacterium]